MIFSAKFQPDSDNLIYSGGWDRQVKFWDIRGNQQTNCFFGPQICGDSIDMQREGRLFVTGGGSGGEGLQIWDLRVLEKGPVKNIPWTVLSNGHVQNPTINVVKFLPGSSVIIAGACDPAAPAKCFSTTTGSTIETFKLARAGYSLDIESERD